MRHLKIQNVGPLKTVDIELQKLNVIIGEQSSGKSCVLKIACYCDWVEKQLAVRLLADKFKEPRYFYNELVRFHKLDGYIRNDSVIEYETDCVKFKYEALTDAFTQTPKLQFFGYQNRKISYIPAERILVSSIPDWINIKLGDNNIRGFMIDWAEARSAIKLTPVLNLGVTYGYLSDTRSDRMMINNGSLVLDLTNVSSGLQSVTPLVVLFLYLCNELRTIESKSSVFGRLEIGEAVERLESLWKNPSTPMGLRKKLDKDIRAMQLNWLRRMSCLDHSNIYLEEPEMNLFPNTQAELMGWMIEQINHNTNHSLFVATHSPYILTELNNLIQASNIVSKDVTKKQSVLAVVPEQRILDYGHVGAFAIEDGVVVSIKDEDLCLIAADKIDDASSVIGQQFDELLSL